MSEGGPYVNTDRELWRGPDEGNGDFYADSIFVTEGGSIGINVGGSVIVKPLRDWHKLACGHLVYDKERRTIVPAPEQLHNGMSLNRIRDIVSGEHLGPLPEVKP